MRGCLFALILLGSTVAVAAQTSAERVYRLESNLSLGYIDDLPVEPPPPGWRPSDRHIAMIKSLWFYPFQPRVLALGISLDFVSNDFLAMLNISLNAPFRTVVPFVSAGVGGAVSGATGSSFGGGLKFRLRRRFGLIAEYRYHRRYKPNAITKALVRSNYVGAGIAYIF